jgi:hypothetical protein
MKRKEDWRSEYLALFLSRVFVNSFLVFLSRCTEPCGAVGEFGEMMIVWFRSTCERYRHCNSSR